MQHSIEKKTYAMLTTVQEFADSLDGTIITPDSVHYDEARGVWNGMIDRFPALIVRCANAEDVAKTVKFARNSNIPTSVRGGGHNVAGNAVLDYGLVIDLSEMQAVTVDAENKIARAEGGATIGHLDAATQVYGLATPSGVFTETGVAGLTLGGGFSWLRRKYGLACDALIGAQVVTANGDIIEANAEENSDLLWGLKGGGGNFGVVTRFDYQLYDVGPDVYLVMQFLPSDKMREGLQFWNKWSATAPDEVSSFAILGFVPAMDEIPAEYHHQETVIFMAMYAGDPEEGKEVLAPLANFTAALADFSDVMPYVEVQKLFDEDYPAGEMHYYWKSRYLSKLDDNAIDTLIALNAQAPSHHSTLDLWQMGGAMSRIPATASAFGDRSAPFLLGIEANWEIGEDDNSNIAWARNVYQASVPFATDRAYLNFPGFYEDADSLVDNAFGENMPRLRELKKRYDPDNFFNRNQNIKPAE